MHPMLVRIIGKNQARRKNFRFFLSEGFQENAIAFLFVISLVTATEDAGSHMMRADIIVYASVPKRPSAFSPSQMLQETVNDMRR